MGAPRRTAVYFLERERIAKNGRDMWNSPFVMRGSGVRIPLAAPSLAKRTRVNCVDRFD